MLENHRLRVFRSVAEHLSFRKAGEALYLTQPAVTLQIRTLEDELGARLFDRGAAGVRLTEAGKLLLPFARQLHELAEQAEQQLASLKGGAAGELLLGASSTIVQYVLPPLLAEFSRRFPAVQLQVASGNTEMVVEGVAAGRFALGLIEGPALRRDVRAERWFDDELLLVVSRNHEWATLNSVEPERLADVPLIMRERGSGSRHVVEQGLQAAGLRLGALRIALESDSSEAILWCVEEGLGVGFASPWALSRRSHGESLRTLRIAGHRLRRSFCFALPAGPETASLPATLMQFLLERAPNA